MTDDEFLALPCGWPPRLWQRRRTRTIVLSGIFPRSALALNSQLRHRFRIGSKWHLNRLERYAFAKSPGGRALKSG